MTTNMHVLSNEGLLAVTISEFSGQGWKEVAARIPFAPGFDLVAIREDDPQPFFVTLPVARVGAQSRGDKKLIYGEVANRKIVEQIMAFAPEGGRGHVPPDKVATQYDLPDVMAVGALLEDGTAWAKFYVPQYATDTREYYRFKMRHNQRAGFSLWGDAKVNPATNEVVDLVLKRIDIADPSRTGLPVEAVPIVTSEMADGSGNAPSDSGRQEDNHMAELTVQLQEMQVQNTRLQADLTAYQTRMAEMAGALGVEQDQIVPTLRTLQAQAQVMAEMASMLDVESGAVVGTVRQLQSEATVARRVAEMLHTGDGEPQTGMVVARITEMQTLIKVGEKAERRQKVLSLIDGTREGVEKPLVALEDLRPVVIAHMGDEESWPETDVAITEMVTGILEQPHIKNIAAKLVAASAGGPAALGATDNGGHGGQSKTDAEINAEAAELAASKGMTRPR